MKAHRLEADRGALERATETLPLVIEPENAGERAIDSVTSWLAARASLQSELTKHGAILFRGFDVDGPAPFERIARAIDPNLRNDYLGTSPRDSIGGHVFSASELPPYYPIPQHCEMSFLASAPRRIFFSALRPNVGMGGETPLVDMRAVARDLPADVRARFESKGVRTIRNYDGPGTKSRFDFWKLKRWDEMFGTTDRDEVAEKCRENGMRATFHADGRLTLVTEGPAFKDHPTTHERVWFNHTQVFHLSAAAGEYRRIAARQRTLRSRALARVSRVMVLAKRAVPDERQAMQATFADGASIPDRDMEAVREAIWKNLVFFRWRKGDVVAIDNDAVAHGRMPYTGPRTVAVCWA